MIAMLLNKSKEANNQFSNQIKATKSLISYPSTIKLVCMIHAVKIPRVN